MARCCFRGIYFCRVSFHHWIDWPVYSEKRKSTIADEIIYDSPTGLPSDLGQKDLLLINAMNSALEEGYSIEYQKMIKKYFRNLQEYDERNSND